MMTWTENDIRRYDIAAIEAALVRLGASPEEADALTDILHTEGWGGIEEQGEDEEGDIRDAALVSMIGWYRGFRWLENATTGEVLATDHQGSRIAARFRAEVARRAESIEAATMSRTTMKTNIAEYQAQGFISARSSKGMDYQKAQSAASAAIGEARGETPIALQGAFHSYIRFVRVPEGGFEYGWILR